MESVLFTKVKSKIAYILNIKTKYQKEAKWGDIRASCKRRNAMVI